MKTFSNVYLRGYKADRSGSDAINPFPFASQEYADFLQGALARQRQDDMDRAIWVDHKRKVNERRTGRVRRKGK